MDNSPSASDIPGHERAALPADESAALPADESAAFPADESAMALRDLADVPAVEVVTTVAVHLMSAAAIRCGLAEEGQEAADLDEARTLINALAALVVASAPDLGSTHAAPLRDGLRSLQLAFRETSPYPDPAGKGPGEKYTGPVLPAMNVPGGTPDAGQ